MGLVIHRNPQIDPAFTRKADLFSVQGKTTRTAIRFDVTRWGIRAERQSILDIEDVLFLMAVFRKPPR